MELSERASDEKKNIIDKHLNSAFKILKILI